MSRTSSGISISGSVETSWPIRAIAKIGLRSSGPAGSPVCGLSGGGGGSPGRSASRLTQVVGISSSPSRNLVTSAIWPILCPRTAARGRGDQTRSGDAQARLERIELRADLVRKPVTERGQMLLELGQLSVQRLVIDAEHLRYRLGRDLQAFGVELALDGQQSEGRIGYSPLAVAAPEDPLQHSAVLAEAGPQELAVLVLPEPVDVEYLGQHRALAAARGEPVAEVVRHVVAAEGQHRHRIEPQLPDLAGRGGRGLGGHDCPGEHAVLPVAALEHERDDRRAATSEQEGVDWNPRGVLPFGRDRGTLGRRGGEAGVGMCGGLIRGGG